jgi:hypothetical protein
VPVRVRIAWDKFRLDGGAHWKDVKNKILKTYDGTALTRCVYVLRLCGPFAIQYVNKASPTLYIGRGDLKQRVTSHLKWINELATRIQGMGFELWLCQPRVRNARNTFADFEAELLNRFYRKFGCLPMFNRRMERANRNRRYVPNKAVKACLGFGSGRAYHWALTPLPSNSGYERYSKGPVNVRYKLSAMLKDQLAV